MSQVPVRVTPRSSKDEIVGWSEGMLHVRVTAPPDGGRANSAVCELVARELGLPKTAVSVVRGTTARHKLLSAEGMDTEAVAAMLGGTRRV